MAEDWLAFTSVRSWHVQWMFEIEIGNLHFCAFTPGVDRQSAACDLCGRGLRSLGDWLSFLYYRYFLSLLHGSYVFCLVEMPIIFKPALTHMPKLSWISYVSEPRCCSVVEFHIFSLLWKTLAGEGHPINWRYLSLSLSIYIYSIKAETITRGLIMSFVSAAFDFGISILLS